MIRTTEPAPRVLFLNPWDKRIGPNRYLIELLRQDSALAHNCIVVLPEEGEAAQEYREIGCQVEIWREARLVHVELSVVNLLRLLQRHTLGVLHAWLELKALRVQVVVTNSENVWFGGMAARLGGVSHLQVFHALTLEHHWGAHARLIRLYLDLLGLVSTRFIAVSGAVAQMLKRNGVDGRRVVLIPNGLDIEATVRYSKQPLPPEIAELIAGHYPVLVSLGRISRIKGQDLLIEALARIRDEYPRMLCFIAGQIGSAEGVDDTQAFFGRLRQRIRELALDEQVEFLGEIDYALALVGHSQVYIQPSRSESFCRAVAEALVCGVPVGAFAVGGIPEILGANGGVLVPAQDTGALAAAVIRLVSDPETARNLAQVGQANVRASFDARCIVRSFRQLLTESARTPARAKPMR